MINMNKYIYYLSNKQNYPFAFFNGRQPFIVEIMVLKRYDEVCLFLGKFRPLMDL